MNEEKTKTQQPQDNGNGGGRGFKIEFAGWLFLLPLAAFIIIYSGLISGKRRLVADDDYYLHYRLAKFSVKGALPPGSRLVVFRKNRAVRGIGGRYSYSFKNNGGVSVANFPIPWRAPDGFYEARIFNPEEKVRNKYLPAVFAVIRRKPSDVKFPVNAANWENTRNLMSMHIPSLSSGTVSWKGIFDWVDYVNADTFLYLGGQTAYFDKSLPKDFPWLPNNLKNLDRVCAQAHRRGKRIGAWAACYIVVGSRDDSLGYTYGINYSPAKDKMVRSRGISIGDAKRLKDIVKVLKRMDLSDLDFLGLDYIRPVKGGFELIDDFLKDMDVTVPAGLKTANQRMLYIARKIFKERDMPMADMWNWWRAHKSALLIKTIKEEVNSKKPLWCFILSWQMGHQHGQDPLMFQDAGADFQTVMLYEGDDLQFSRLIKQWGNYGVEGLNLVVGDQVDFPVHQFSESPPATQVFENRIKTAKEVLQAKGVFVNDLSRAFWGRKGPYTAKEWLEGMKREIVKVSSGTVSASR